MLLSATGQKVEVAKKVAISGCQQATRFYYQCFG
jgi:hypothetical protein